MLKSQVTSIKKNHVLAETIGLSQTFLFLQDDIMAIWSILLVDAISVYLDFNGISYISEE